MTGSGGPRLLGLDIPLALAPIGSACTPALVAAVSETGALGILAGSWSDGEQLANHILAIQAATSRVFGVNLVLYRPQRERLAVVLDHGVPIVSTFWGDPAPYRRAIAAAGALHIHTVGSSEEARAAADLGVDVLVAQGWEAGGHVRGTTSTLALVPAVVDRVHPLPVFAAGGIADARGVSAVHALGAVGAWVGTRFLLAQEAATHPTYRERLIAAVGEDCVYTTAFRDNWPNAPHRALRNSTMERWLDAGSSASGARPGEGDIVARHSREGAVLRYADKVPTDEHVGDIEAMAMYAGQGTELLRSSQPAKEIVTELARGCPRPTP
ncbi:nitronate monooxygenase family protein [Amycolatopsis sp. EV170708-02-1]|uniref:NAD(P)H-dependent flavin oxidoreductase n=1 Tax=Amycolatopsis sp. EV170708-02-1 TaxID=2919322 RepID=UPI001F0C69C5|nr:nitronate monooxygenase [Amycolatopsis sp. EV170708-02-1]UMP00013.1 nitronate monooxygenase [Amycolatopsis sp. EV170708-02-1]